MLATQSLRFPAATSVAGTAGRPVPASCRGTHPVQGLRLATAHRVIQPSHNRAQAQPKDGVASTVEAEAPKAGCGRKRLFDDLGGAEGLKLAVDIFYEKVLGDLELQPFFQAVDMKQQKAKQVKFMTFVFGGPDQYTGRSMHDSHADLVKYQGLDHRHFDKIKQYLGETLQEMGVAQEMIERAAAIVESTRKDFDFPKK